MQRPLSRMLLRYLFIFFICIHKATADWSGEAYGGKFYDYDRLGTYLVYSNPNPQNFTVIGELLYEHYTDYEFAGIGGHFLWSVSQPIDIGIVASQAWESYDFGGFEKIDYQTSIVGIELEFNSERVTLAAQTGQYLADFEDEESMYLSADLYFYGADYNWYLRGATRWIETDSLHFIEGYHTTYMMERPLTTYLGVSVKNSSLSSREAVDLIYIGAYVELFSAPSSALFLWTEVAEANDDTFLTIELSLLFGPGARTPYITSFGFSVTNQ
jgi:hypothetical protein